MSMLVNRIKETISEEVKTYNIKEFVVIDADIVHNIHISIEIMKCENGNYLISESDIEVPSHIESLITPAHLANILITDSIHDWSDEFKELHYHFITTQAINITTLLKVLKYFFTINKYIRS